MSKENIGYYESNIQTSRNVENIKDARIDGVIAIKLWSLTKQVDNLIKENQELKEQLKIKHDGFMASIEEKCELADENQKLKEMQCTFLGTGCQNKIKEYKIQQREFIDWLGSLVVSDLGVFTEIKVCDVLSKYKEIVGVKDE